MLVQAQGTRFMHLLHNGRNGHRLESNSYPAHAHTFYPLKE